MEIILTGDNMNAEEAMKRGLVSKVFPHADLIPEALACAAKIAEFSNPIVQMAKECVNASFEMPLAQGVLFERRMFHATFGFADRKEGMEAFLAKRKPEFTNK
jgi:enoyl-CoA hydratase